MNKFSLHVEIFQHWLNNFEELSFDVAEEDLEDTKNLLHKLITKQEIDQGEIELLYTLSLDNTLAAKNDFIKFQAKTIINFLNSDILENIIRE
jgi:hypothetical protein